MKLLLLHMHVIVNMTNLFEHTILGNVSYFFLKNLKATNQGDPYLCREPYAIICIVVDETNSSTKIHGFTPLIGEVHFIFG
jgi:hypothetical protein